MKKCKTTVPGKLDHLSNLYAPVYWRRLKERIAISSASSSNHLQSKMSPPPQMNLKEWCRSPPAPTRVILAAKIKVLRIKTTTTTNLSRHQERDRSLALAFQRAYNLVDLALCAWKSGEQGGSRSQMENQNHKCCHQVTLCRTRLCAQNPFFQGSGLSINIPDKRIEPPIREAKARKNKIINPSFLVTVLAWGSSMVRSVGISRPMTSLGKKARCRMISTLAAPILELVLRLLAKETRPFSWLSHRKNC